MPVQLDVPLEKDYVLERTDATFGTADGEPTVVTIRQATQGQHERRAAMFSQVIREVPRDTAEDVVRFISRFSVPELMRIETFLTMRACNLKDATGKDLFKFDAKGRMKRETFNTAWDMLPAQIAEEIHECVLDLNVMWRPEGEGP